MFCDENFLKISVHRISSEKLYVEVKHHYAGCYFGQSTTFTNDEALKVIDVLLEINSGHDMARQGNVVARRREESKKTIVRISRDDGLGFSLPIYGLRTLASALCDSFGGVGLIRSIEENLAGVPHEVSETLVY